MREVLGLETQDFSDDAIGHDFRIKIVLFFKS